MSEESSIETITDINVFKHRDTLTFYIPTYCDLSNSVYTFYPFICGTGVFVSQVMFYLSVDDKERL